MPCKNGGTCIDKPDDKYVCTCPRCGCSTVDPFENCEIGMCNECIFLCMDKHVSLIIGNIAASFQVSDTFIKINLHELRPAIVIYLN